MRMMIPAFEFRRRARMAMKAVMPVLLVVALIASLPTLINDTVILIADVDPNSLMTDFSNRLMQVMEKHGFTQPEVVGELNIDQTQVLTDILAVYDQLNTDFQTFLQEKGLLLACLTLMVLIVAPVLTLGMLNALLHALRKKEFTAAIALSRLPYILKAVGLEALVALKLVIWMLPGMAVSLASLAVPPQTVGLMRMAGFAMMFIMGMVASYRYAMATFVMADEPTTRIRDCVRRSCEVMHHRKFELFSLEISFIGWHLLLTLVQSMLLGFGAVVGLTLGMFASLFLTVYTNCAKAAFYQAYAVAPQEAPQAAAEPEAEELV